MLQWRIRRSATSFRRIPGCALGITRAYRGIQNLHYLRDASRTLNVHAEDGSALTGTGYDSDRTRQPVANFQRQDGIEATGAADAATREALSREHTHCNRGPEVPRAGSHAAPSVTDATDPDHRLYAEVRRRIAEQTGHSPKSEAVAIVTLQKLENGFRSEHDIRGLAVRGSDVHVQDTVQGARVSVDLDAPTVGMQQMSEHMAKQAQAQQQEVQQQTSRSTGI